MPRGSKFSVTRTGNIDLDRIQQAVADTFDQLEDLRRGMLTSAVKSTAGSLQVGENLVAVYTGPGNHVFTLPRAALRGPSRGQFLCIANMGKGALTVTAARNETINGLLASLRLAVGTNLLLFSDGLLSWSAMTRNDGRGWESYQHAGGSALERWYYAGCNNSATLAPGVPTINVLRAFPFIAPARGGTVDRIGFNCTTLAAGSSGRVGLYDNVADEGNLYPGALLVDGGTQSTAAAGVKQSTVSVKLKGGGLYWLAFVTGVLAPTVQCLGLANMSHILGVANTLATTPNVGLSVAFVFAAMPAAFPGGAADIVAVPLPALAYRMTT